MMDEESDKQLKAPFLRLHEKVEATKNQMVQNVNKAVEMTDNLKEVQDAAESLELNADEFKDLAKRLASKKKKKNAKLWLCLVVVLIALFIFGALFLFTAIYCGMGRCK